MTSEGQAALEHLGDEVSLDDVRAVLASFAAAAGVDRSWDDLMAATGGRVDPSIAAHRDAVVRWLRRWGCRHLRTADHRRTSASLLTWWRGHGSILPRTGTTLDRLGERATADAARAYAALAERPAARRRHGDGEVDVAFGETAAAKAMFALRPRVFPPWDEPIRAAFGRGEQGAARYERYLTGSRLALRGLARRAGMSVPELPAILGRPGSTPAKIVDEYLWITVTRGR